jgi:hypothetical protein
LDFLALWSRIIFSPSLKNFRYPASPVFSAEKTWLRLAQSLENPKQFGFSRFVVTDNFFAVAQKFPLPRLARFFC